MRRIEVLLTQPTRSSGSENYTPYLLTSFNPELTLKKPEDIKFDASLKTGENPALSPQRYGTWGSEPDRDFEFFITAQRPTERV